MNSTNEGYFRTRVEMPIRRVVVSPNDEVTAFMLETIQEGKRALRLALYPTQEILKSARRRYDLRLHRMRSLADNLIP